MAQHSFCESVAAGSKGRWHIRRLTFRGAKPGGGADTSSLCGVKVAWDVPAQITHHQLQSCCPQCAKAYIEDESR